MNNSPKFNINVKLTGKDGNAFTIMGKVKLALKKAGATEEEISEYINESMSGDYNHLLRTAQTWVNVT